MGDLAEIVDLDTVANDGGFHLRPVDGRTGTDFDIVADDDIAQMFDLLPGAIFLRGIAETIGTDHGIRVDDDIVPNYHARIDNDAGIEDAILADTGMVADIDMLIDFRAVPYFGVVSHIGKVPNIYFLAELRGEIPAAEDAPVALVLTPLRTDVFEQLRDGRIGILDPDQGRGHRLLGHECLIYQQDRSLAGIDVLLVFRVGVEAKFARLAMLDLGETRYSSLRIPFYGPSQHLGQLSGSIFHKSKIVG